MADGASFQVHVRRNEFPRFANVLPEKVDRVVRKAAADVEAQAKIRAAVDTGFMRASISSHRVSPCHYRVTVGAEYAPYVELGTRHMAAQPFLRPAFEAVLPTMRQALRRVIE